MSTTELGRSETLVTARPAAAGHASALDALRLLLSPLASLRLTVVLLALSIFLVLAGTLAQVDHDILYVLSNYFRTVIAWIELRIFFPRDWNISPQIVFAFPGGKLIGCGLAINLLAAHAVRFKMAAHGVRLWLGWCTILLGALITYAVIVSGAGTTVESAMSASFANGLWHALRAALGATALTLAYVLALSRATAKKSAAAWLWWFTAAVAVLLAALALYLFTHPAARLNASGLRILWQLAKASAASIVLGAGCWAVFSKRAGIVLLHSGVGLMMFTELYTAQHVVEARMTIEEGQTAYAADDIRHSELAFIDADAPGVDRNVVIPESLLIDAANTRKTISHKDLPVDVRVVDYLPNATWRRVQPGEKSGATAGIGQLDLLEAQAEASGVAMEQSVELPAAYVELLSKHGGKSLGVYLTRSLMRGEPLAVDGKHYEMALRFKRIPKPYSVTLLDFKFDRYIGTNTAKNFESVVRFQDPAHDVDRTASIWMNNPLRYGGDTLYQADWNHETERGTVFQVMTNAGWMIPYVACMIVAAGMAVHFGQGIIRFVMRREDEAKRQAINYAGGFAGGTAVLPDAKWTRLEVLIPLAIVLLAIGMTAMFAKPPREAALDLHIQEFGRLPVAFGGRTQPMDSLARNTLRVVSGKATYKDSRYPKPQPAIRWFLDVVSQSPEFRDHRVIRIENLDVLKALQLKQRPGDWRYSLAEIFADATQTADGEFQRQKLLAYAVPEDKRDLTQRKFVELSEKVSTVLTLRQAFDIPDVGEFGERLLQDQKLLEASVAELNANPRTPRPVPPATTDAQWLTIYESSYNVFRQIATTGREPAAGDATQPLLRIFGAYRKEDPTAFNAALSEYEKVVARIAAVEDEHEARLAETGARSNRKPAERLDLARIAFESFYNHFDPFVVCIGLYVVAFALAALAWAGWSQGFNRSANGLLWFTFALHTFGIICRIYISGRPPVTNLYSSAVFIGWACVLFGLLFEAIYKLGIGNLLAAVIGVPTMFIAYQLTFDETGDTLGVMQAVLDTNFWLGTHVVCVAMGYSATLAAGGLGLITLVLGHLSGVFGPNERRQLSRMTYGALCFALFFSFIGTVLGGLWADDSWGRFWGWDPKENGALMIVLWNALVLHARWGKMTDERSFACLTVLGNIVVAWSWWGVNQLSIGLHNYGWTAGLTMWLVLFAASQFAVVAVAYLLPLFSNRASIPSTSA